MSSFDHELLVELFRNRPELARELLRGRPEVRLGRGRAALASIDLSEVASPEYRCDALVTFHRPDVSDPEHAIIVEIQLARAPTKKRSWPAYVTIARARLRCPVTLLVLAPDDPDAPDDTERSSGFENLQKCAREFERKYVQHGRREALRQTVSKLLGVKFGTITADTEARVASATPEELDDFLERILTAGSVAAVLAPTAT